MDHGAIEQFLAALKQSGSRRLDRDCADIAQRYFDEKVEPQFTVWSADFDADPSFVLADRYWNLRFREKPTLHTAIECAGWLNEHTDPEVLEPVREKWAMGYGFITRDTIDSVAEIAEATADIIAGDPGGSRAYFAVLYHAAKLRADQSFDELLEFLESSPLSVSIRGQWWSKPLFVALRAFAACGSARTSVAYARELLETAWNSPDRTRQSVDVVLNGIAVGNDFDGRGELLRTWAVEALSEFPGDHMFLFRLATGQRLCRDFAQAQTTIGKAKENLPATGWRISHSLLQGQFDLEKQLIDNELAMARQVQAAQEDQGRFMSEMSALVESSEQRIDAIADRYEQKMRDLAEAVQRDHVRTIEIVALFAAAITFAIGTLNITLSGNVTLAERLWMITGLCGGLLVFAIVIIVVLWMLYRRK